MEKDTEGWLKMVTDNVAITSICCAIVCEGKLIDNISFEKKIMMQKSVICFSTNIQTKV